MIQVGTFSLQYNFGTTPNFVNNRAIKLALFVSVVTHVAAFVSTKNIDLKKYQWQAPELAVEVSLNFLHSPSRPYNQSKVAIPIRKSAQDELRSKTKSFPDSRAATANAPAAAPKVADKSRRGETNNSDLVHDNYLSDLLTYIEGYKYYPQAARRRNLRGAINVSFLLLKSGDIAELQVAGDAMLLRRAAEQAVRRALPLPPPPDEISNPKRVSFIMQYQLH